MATVEQCELAFHDLAGRLAGADDGARNRANLDRTISCTLSDLGVIFAGRLQHGELTGIRQVDGPDAQVRMKMTSDDLVKLVSGELSMGSAWATGRVRIDAGVFDLIKLRSVF